MKNTPVKNVIEILSDSEDSVGVVKKSTTRKKKKKITDSDDDEGNNEEDQGEENPPKSDAPSEADKSKNQRVRRAATANAAHKKYNEDSDEDSDEDGDEENDEESDADSDEDSDDSEDGQPLIARKRGVTVPPSKAATPTPLPTTTTTTTTTKRGAAGTKASGGKGTPHKMSNPMSCTEAPAEIQTTAAQKSPSRGHVTGKGDSKDNPQARGGASRVELHVAEKLARNKILVELPPDTMGLMDLSGDVGAVGRLVVRKTGGSSGGDYGKASGGGGGGGGGSSSNPLLPEREELKLDLKGIEFGASVVSLANTILVVNTGGGVGVAAGDGKARVEAIFSDFLQLREERNMYTEEEMVEGQRDWEDDEDDEDMGVVAFEEGDISKAAEGGGVGGKKTKKKSSTGTKTVKAATKAVGGVKKKKPATASKAKMVKNSTKRSTTAKGGAGSKSGAKNKKKK